ncbi:MAG: alpha/beta hydrolase [Planctomycetaceae bacterium]
MTHATQTIPARTRGWKRRLRRLLVLAAVAYLIVCGLVGYWQRSLIYYPVRAQPTALAAEGVRTRGAQVESVTVNTDDGLQLHGWRLVSDAAPGVNDAGAPLERAAGRPLAIFLSGNGGNRGWRLPIFEPLTAAGADVLIVDYRGYAENGGDPTEEGLARDARAVWRYAVDDLEVDPRRIILFGESLGGGVAVRLAAELCDAGTPPAGLILLSTFSSLTDTAALHFSWLPVRWLLQDRFDSISRISRVTCPILSIHGRRDSIVPYELGRRLFDACLPESSNGIPKRMIDLPQADHNDILRADGPTFRRAVRDFVDQVVPHSPRVADGNQPPMLEQLIRSLTYFPDRARDLSPAALGLSAEQFRPVEIETSDHLTLNGWHVAADRAAETGGNGTPRPTALFFSGNGGHRQYRLPELSLLTAAGADALLVDYRGYGDNPGSPSESDLADDARTLWKFATTGLSIPPQLLILYGESLGGAVAVRLAAELCGAKVEPGGLVLRSTFTRLVDVAGHHYPLLPVRYVLTEKFDSLSRIGEVTCPLLMLHGSRDRIVPFQFGEALFAAAPDASTSGSPKRFVALTHSDHNDVLQADGRLLQQEVAAFVQQVAAHASLP